MEQVLFQKLFNMFLEHFDKKNKKEIGITKNSPEILGQILKVKEKQFFTGTVTKISGHKLTLSQPGLERIFSYCNPQIQILMAVPKRRSKSRKILWRKKTRQKRGARKASSCYGEIGKHTSLRGLGFSVQVRVATYSASQPI